MTKTNCKPRKIVGLWCAVEVVGWFYIAASALACLSVLLILTDDANIAMIAGAGASISGALVSATYCIGAILTLVWYYQATRNLHAMHVKIDHEPHWAVLWFFIPFLALFKPYGVTAELWRASLNPDGWRKDNEPILFRFWWGLFLVGVVTSQVGNFILRNPEPEYLQLGAPWIVGGLACFAICGCLFLHIGRTITLKQRDLMKAGYRRATPENIPSWAV